MSYGQPEVRNSRRAAGRGERIRTSDILLPKQARYRTALHPEQGAILTAARYPVKFFLFKVSIIEANGGIMRPLPEG